MWHTHTAYPKTCTESYVGGDGEVEGEEGSGSGDDWTDQLFDYLWEGKFTKVVVICFFVAIFIFCCQILYRVSQRDYILCAYLMAITMLVPSLSPICEAGQIPIASGSPPDSLTKLDVQLYALELGLCRSHPFPRAVREYL
jgi:hypothetical protein